MAERNPSGSIEALVAMYIERRELDGSLDAAAFAAEHPEREVELRTALNELEAAEQMFPDAPLAAPVRVGEWRVLGELGRGGAGRVLRVAREGDAPGTERALKVLAHGAVADVRALSRMQREGELLDGLDHPGIVRVHGVGVGDAGPGGAGPWVVMDLIEGPSLAVRLADARADSEVAPLRIGDGEDVWRGIARFGARLADALGAAHAAGLLHRDVKPSNVLLRDGGEPVLIDFGLATSDGAATLTRTGDLIGTPHYMAPEQARGERADGRTDIWGLGAVLFEIVTLEPPVDARDPLAAIESLRRRRPRRLDGRTGNVPAPLARIIDRALSFRRERRFRSVEAMGQALRAYADGEEPRVASSSVLERVEDALRARPSRTLALGAAALTIVAATGAGVWSDRVLGTTDSAASTASASDLRREMCVAWIERDRTELGRIADELQDQGRGEEADLARGLAELAPLPVDSQDALVRAIARAEAARRGSSYEDALAGFASASAMAADWALPIVGVGRTARESGDLSRAISEWRAAARLVPESASLRRRLGKVLRARAPSKKRSTAIGMPCGSTATTGAITQSSPAASR